MRKPWRVAAAILFVVTVLAGGLAGERLLAVSSDLRASVDAFTELIDTARAEYGAEVPYRDLVFASIQGMLRTLDPHTSFLPPEALTTMRDRQQTTFSGLGILVGTRNGQLTVISPIEGSPAARLGVRAGDIIETIEGNPTEEMSLEDAVQKLKGPKGTEVSITLLRRGLAEPLALTITREEIPQTTVRYAYMLDPDTGYVLLSDFARGTGDELETAIAELRAEGMKRLILDLRNNGGGLLDQAIAVADQFVPKGEAIVETRGRGREAYQQYEARGEHPLLGLPAVVVVNHGTASASEIVAGAIQDHDLGVIVGVPTWGKGLVQTVFNLPYGAGLALTTAKYYTPSGRLIQRDFESFFEYAYGGDDDGAVPGPAADDPAYSTDLGRTVYGGGGITPDVRAEPQEVPTFLQYLYARNAFFDFAVDHNRRHGAPTAADAPAPPESETIAAFKAWLAAASLGTPAEHETAFADADTRALALRQIHAEILNTSLGLEAGHKVMAQGDPQIRAALAQFDQAASLLAQRAARSAEPQRIAAGGGQR
jgi:carboxyl-terminal processing protease